MAFDYFRCWRKAENKVEPENVEVITTQEPINIQPTGGLDEKPQEAFNFTKLPFVPRHHILSYLNPTTLANFARCSKDCELDSRRHLPVKLYYISFIQENEKLQLEFWLIFGRRSIYVQFFADLRKPEEYVMNIFGTPKNYMFSMKGDALEAGYRYLSQKLKHVKTDMEFFCVGMWPEEFMELPQFHKYPKVIEIKFDERTIEGIMAYMKNHKVTKPIEIKHACFEFIYLFTANCDIETELPKLRANYLGARLTLISAKKVNAQIIQFLEFMKHQFIRVAPPGNEFDVPFVFRAKN